MYNTSNPAELYPNTTWELLPSDKFLKTGATPLQQGGSNSIKLTKANLPTEKLQVESFSLTTSPHNHTFPGRGNYVDNSGVVYAGGIGGGSYTIKTSSVDSMSTSPASPYTTAMGNGTPLSINPEHITVKAWKRLS